MKHIKLLYILMLLISTNVFAQNNDIKDSVNYKLIKDFIDYVKNKDSLSINKFRYFFHDTENQKQKVYAEELYCEKKKIPQCQSHVDNVVYHRFDNKVLNYFLKELKQYFQNQDSIINIRRLKKTQNLFYIVQIVNTGTSQHKTFYFNMGYTPFGDEKIFDFFPPAEIKYYDSLGYKPDIEKYAIISIIDSTYNSIIELPGSYSSEIKDLKKALDK